MNISEIAKLAGVSKTTVSRILNNSEHVSDKTREAVLQVIRNNNYAPSSLAQGLAKNENSAIGVIIPEIDNEFFSEVLSGINEVVDQHNLSMICCDTNNNTNREAKALRTLSQQRVRGVIITPAEEGNEELRKALQTLKIPIVVLDRHINNSLWDGVYYDNFNAAYAATEVLVKEGYTKIGVTLTFGTWDADAMKLYDELDIESRFQQLYPNVTLEIEEYKDDIEYFNAMKIRASAKELPDIMFNVNRTLANFAEYLYDLSDLDAAKNNILAEGYAIDGKVLGLPEKRQEEYVLFWRDMFDEAGVEVPQTWDEFIKNNILAEGYAIDGKVLGLPEKRQEEYVLFWRDMFDEAGVEVPQTWDEFIKVSIRLQEYFGKSNPNFMAIALGAKDEWPIYPLVENMPSAISGNGQYWNEMAEKDRPFEKGSDIQVAYEKMQSIERRIIFMSNIFALKGSFGWKIPLDDMIS